VALTTSDPDRGAAFYRDVLGFRETPRPAFNFRGSWLLHPRVGVMVHLIHDAQLAPAGEVAAEGLNTRSGHLAIRAEDYDQAIAHLQHHGITYVERVLPDYGYRQVFFRDPDGNLIELGEWPTQAEMFPALIEDCSKPQRPDP
jgi:catechol 2,3-dioxygenase-like lactoylglutathione lyase family enzyme